MHDKLLEDIVRSCYSLDAKAIGIYRKLSLSAESDEVKAFWEDMSRQEKEHVEFWKQVLALTTAGALPQMFDNPARTKEELAQREVKIDELLRRAGAGLNRYDAFFLALNLEFYLLHPALENLFRFAKIVGEDSPADTYEAHLDDFVKGLEKYGIARNGSAADAQLELLCQVLRQLWDLTKRIAVESYQDGLTGVLNRRGLFRALTTVGHLAQRNGFRVGVLMLDLDRFKAVNDTHGHPAGDEALKMTAHIIAAQVRANDLVGRYGGEEFLVFLTQVETADLRQVAEKIRRSVEKESQIHIPITVSVGAASGLIKGDVEEEMAGLIQAADVCLYRAKHGGRNRVVLSDV